MSLYIFNFIKVDVVEVSSSKICIWCKKDYPKNISHIFSKRLIKTNKPSNILRKCVCKNCNSFFGSEVEDWFLKYSPIGVWSQQYFDSKSKILKSLKYVPNFFWSQTLREWILINHDKVPDFLGTQLILDNENNFILSYYDITGKLERDELKEIDGFFYKSALENNYSKYITSKLPTDFSPRLFLFKGKVIIVARTESDSFKIISKLINTYDEKKLGEGIITLSKLKSIDRLTINYYWSLKRYIKLCAKIGFEFLCLFKDSSFCLNKIFDDFKAQILKDNFYDKLVIPFEEGKGYNVKRLTAPGWISYVPIEKNIRGFPIINVTSPNKHQVFIYESDGYLLMTIKLFNIEACQIVVANEITLDDIYYVEYDYINDEIEFFISNKLMEIKPEKMFKEVINEFDKNDKMITATLFSEDNRPFFKLGFNK